MKPRATFVIPAFNADRWISKAIMSCRNQTVKQIEILVINDGSYDGTKDIITWHASRDPRVVGFHNINAGRSAARNFGNTRATSEIIMVLDADDTATKNRAKETIAMFEAKKPDLVYGSFFAMDSMGNVQNKIVSSPFDPELAKTRKLNFICHSTMAYTKKLAMDVKYDEGVYSDLGLDDWRFQWDVYRKGGKMRDIKTPLCYYRITESGTMATRDPKAVEEAKEKYLAQI